MHEWICQLENNPTFLMRCKSPNEVRNLLVTLNAYAAQSKHEKTEVPESLNEFPCRRFAMPLRTQYLRVSLLLKQIHRKTHPMSSQTHVQVENLYREVRHLPKHARQEPMKGIAWEYRRRLSHQYE